MKVSIEVRQDMCRLYQILRRLPHPCDKQERRDLLERDAVQLACQSEYLFFNFAYSEVGTKHFINS